MRPHYIWGRYPAFPPFGKIVISTVIRLGVVLLASLKQYIRRGFVFIDRPCLGTKGWDEPVGLAVNP